MRRAENSNSSDMFQWICSGLLFLSAVSIYVVRIKVYPVVFLLFSASLLLLWITPQPIALLSKRLGYIWWGCWLYVLYAATNYLLLGGSGYYLLKLCSNVAFFAAITIYCQLACVSGNESMARRSLICACIVVVTLSCLQVLSCVARGNLWLLPLHITSSTEAYAIQDAATIYFGDANKNIWASKVVLSYLSFIALRGDKWKGWGIALFCMVLIILVYTSSRTAELAFLLGLLFHWAWRLRRNGRISGKLALVLLTLALTPVAISILRLPSTVSDIAESSSNDGFFARLVLWSYFAGAAPLFGIRECLVGHGVFSVAPFVSSQFEEDNLHNVFLNQFYDFGLIGLVLYGSFLVYWFRTTVSEWRWLIVPALVIILNSQYVGYDAELMLCYSLGILLTYSPDTEARRRFSKS